MVALYILVPTVLYCHYTYSMTLNIGNLYSDVEGQVTSLAALQMAERDLREKGVINDSIKIK